PGVEVAYPVHTNAVFCRIPAYAVTQLLAWTPFYEWDPATSLVRFVASWDTTTDDVDRLAAGVAAAVAT
ncbi:MAG: Low specificity L-threonine aldolase, partial [Actinomycetia bacterium]|nr:Low specificity L-threonine aldolase [Actinomycetes bacterium]